MGLVRMDELLLDARGNCRAVPGFECWDSGSVQAILIPPSHNAVLYSLAAGGTVSIAALFMAGVLPGLLMAMPMASRSLVQNRRRLALTFWDLSLFRALSASASP